MADHGLASYDAVHAATAIAAGAEAIMMLDTAFALLPSPRRQRSSSSSVSTTSGENDGPLRDRSVDHRLRPLMPARRTRSAIARSSSRRASQALRCPSNCVHSKAPSDQRYL
jgi:hypothetical protein